MAEARELILAAVRPPGHETVGLAAAAGRVLGEAIESRVEIPPADNSAMDGYALRAADAASVPVSLAVVDDLPAGKRSQRAIGPGEAARIMTGAAIPEGADAVVMIERTDAPTNDAPTKSGASTSGPTVRILESAKPGQHIRRAGSDVQPGTRIAEPGTVLHAAHIGMFAATGRTAIRVAARPRVAILATGDELVEPDRLEPDGRIVSSNSYALAAAVGELGLEPVYLGIAPDEPEQIAASFREALRCDVVISTGGVSVGDRDWIKQVLAELGGQMRLWRVNMKPGAPLAFVTLEGRPVFGLPGNPVSTLVAFEQFVRPALLKMMQRRQLFRPVEQAFLTRDYQKPAGRLHFVRVELERRADGLHATPTGEQTSNILLSMVRADGLAIVDPDATRVAAGERVLVQLIRSGDLSEAPGF